VLSSKWALLKKPSRQKQCTLTECFRVGGVSPIDLVLSGSHWSDVLLITTSSFADLVCSQPHITLDHGFWQAFYHSTLFFGFSLGPETERCVCVYAHLCWDSGGSNMVHYQSCKRPSVHSFLF
jgi:hypothetical protein